ncbi:GIN domain-containing protein [Terricaulis silvestris]|uniref:Putative auto-transporter adhesin head GIN domain-containing protein n=1 Tax=Terricaulis silvestris TaxID=2686094 RepID=A0A6I6MVJ0_9CAUL|nr:DUF2807 domain-containing protein [Terricaulis silvestris]QGZ95183.1 hypothetical protein DSM104635_02027 [Terricaulis silvestris]
MKYLIAPALIALALATAAQAETRNLTGFDGVGAADKIDVYVTQGEGFRVEVTGRDAARVRTEVSDGNVLQISSRSRSWWGGTPDLDATVRVTMPAIENLAAAKGATLTATNIRAGNLDLAAAMGAELDVSGTCSRVDITAAMGASVDAEHLICNEADVSASMGADIELNATQSFDASASMGASVNNSGAGAARDVSASMGASVN